MKTLTKMAAAISGGRNTAKNSGRTFLKKCLLGVFAISSPAAVFAQADIHFSQFYETSILRNPALTGIFGDDFKLGAYYRNQWNSISNPFPTFLVPAETLFPISAPFEDFISFGLLSYYEKAG